MSFPCTCPLGPQFLEGFHHSFKRPPGSIPQTIHSISFLIQHSFIHSHHPLCHLDPLSAIQLLVLKIYRDVVLLKLVTSPMGVSFFHLFYFFFHFILYV